MTPRRVFRGTASSRVSIPDRGGKGQVGARGVFLAPFSGIFAVSENVRSDKPGWEFAPLLQRVPGRLQGRRIKETAKAPRRVGGERQPFPESEAGKTTNSCESIRIAAKEHPLYLFGFVVFSASVDIFLGVLGVLAVQKGLCNRPERVPPPVDVAAESSILGDSPMSMRSGRRTSVVAEFALNPIFPKGLTAPDCLSICKRHAHDQSTCSQKSPEEAEVFEGSRA